MAIRCVYIFQSSFFINFLIFTCLSVYLWPYYSKHWGWILVKFLWRTGLVTRKNLLDFFMIYRDNFICSRYFLTAFAENIFLLCVRLSVTSMMSDGWNWQVIRKSVLTWLTGDFVASWSWCHRPWWQFELLGCFLIIHGD